ncbi:hypothetical protein SS1G_08380 [Sclerotinia sclerotiorum 1980 UF-70]|uniref:uridine/cytidine kinase n=1 Tax=Sclerotinia sclerotiorum (strain ATCC 18683 / 1980 / Ss-1) TaxID=665079 RepID=A7ESS5_SCLS1|nr:hypothetical protein SS1G_08380 [Sclerotinia sclerotiorum 1980 UF-70]EDN92517.1 hypothetical protein SS1G_08380 [Sclerotinia sclerotiorum 1980 UF-70]
MAVSVKEQAHYSPPWAGDSFYKSLDEEGSRKAFLNEYDFDSPDAIDFDVLVDILRDLKAGDVAERGRDIEGVIKQWFGFVKPNFQRYVEPQGEIADIIVPRGVENRVAINMVVQYIQRTLKEKSIAHIMALKKLGLGAEDEPLSESVLLLEQTPQFKGMNTIIQDVATPAEEFVFYFDRIATLLVEHAMNNIFFTEKTVETPMGNKYQGLIATGEVSAVVVLRAGGALETGLKRVIPDCKTGRLLIQSNIRTGEPELHFLSLPDNIDKHDSVLLLDPQLSSGGAALMSVQILVDHGVPQEKIVFVTYTSGKMGLNRLTKVFPKVRIVVCTIIQDFEERWIEKSMYWLKDQPPIRSK